MTTAPPEAHTDGLSWMSFLTPDPAPQSYRAAQRMCASSYCPCYANPNSKSSLTFVPSPIYQSCCTHHSLSPSTATLCRVPAGLQSVEDSAAAGTADGHARMAEEDQEGEEVPLMQPPRPVLVPTTQGKGRLGRYSPVPIRYSINAYCRWGPGVPGVGPLQPPNPGW